MKRNNRKYLALSLIAFAVVMGAAKTVVAFDAKGLGFNAPQVNDKTNVVNPQLGDIIFDDSDNTFYGRDNLGNWQSFGSGGTSSNPVGTIIAYAGTGTPAGGYLPCDGASLDRTTYSDLFAAISTTWGAVDGSHFNVPNAQGVFLRGAGSQTISSIGYSATLGATQGDQFQGHWHQVNGSTGSGANTSGILFQNPVDLGQVRNSTTQSPISDGTNGTPRTGSETRPANIGVKYFIKY